MKTYLATSILCLAALFGDSFAQTTPMDFNRKDCNGIQRHLFGDLAAGNAVIIEYFMINCAPCPAAGLKLESMKSNLLAQYPGKIISYAIAFNNTYSQATVNNWVTSNGFSAIPMDSGATQVAYYGGMGMPTIVILAGKTTHSVLGSPYIGFNTNDTTIMAADIRTYLNSLNTGTTVGISTNASKIDGLSVYPNPANSDIVISFSLKQSADVIITVYDLNGKLVKRVETAQVNGTYKKTISLSEISSGTYLVKVSANNQTVSQKITVVH